MDCEGFKGKLGRHSIGLRTECLYCSPQRNPLLPIIYGFSTLKQS